MLTHERQAAATYSGRVHVQRVRLNSGGYTDSGCYFGTGAPLYCIWDDDYICSDHVRAYDRADALQIARDRYPLARIAGLPDPIVVGACEPVTIWEVETTDTFGGRANYSWVQRATVVTPADTDTHRTRVIRQLRQAAGLTGCRAKFHDYGDMVEWRHSGACAVTFAIPQY
jgi:hypothetical protein